MIRDATFMDIPFLLNLGSRYCEEEVKVLGHHSPAWDIDLSANAFCASLHNDNIFLKVAVSDGVVVGFLWAAIHELAPWCSSKVASDYLFYVTPEKRGGTFGLSLIRAYKLWAEIGGCKEVRLSIGSGINETRIGKMYGVLGFQHFGSVYNYRVKES